MTPKYPIYIPSKGRWDSRLTMKSLDRIGVQFRVVVEPQEFDKYAGVLGESRLLVLPHQDKGLVATRNWIWDHALESGTPKFWTIDDNITRFYRYTRNLKVPVSDGSMFAAAETFVDRYGNVPVAGFQYFMFVIRKEPARPYVLNTRVYSNMLIQTDASDSSGKPFRNEGFFNDDTDLCLRILKDGLCTILFNAFLIEKSVTMTVKGGMTPYYQDDGRWKMAEELRQKHPDVTKVVKKWGRWQHHVDYSGFKHNRLKRKPGIEIPQGVDNFGMQLQRKVGDEWVPA